MRFLGVLLLGLILAWAVGDVSVAELNADDLAQLGDGIAAKRRAVGSHIGDQADSLAANRDPLVQLLGQAHGVATAKAQLACGFLLEGRGAERRRGIAACALLLNA